MTWDGDQTPDAGSKMLVLLLLLPPLTRIRPSGSMLVPGQNMSWPVMLTSSSVASPVAGS
jgi:hypothetical protein